MKLKKYKAHILIILPLLLAALGVFAQEPQKSFELKNPVSGSKTYIARDHITLKDGFSYKPGSSSETFIAKIDKKMICPSDYLNSKEVVDLGNKPLDKNLAVGVTSGNIAVSPGGGANYQIPILTPPGVAGMQPKISVVYNSRSGSNILGQAWNLGGLSSISRVSSTFYHDNKNKGVNLDSNDKFALDGKRLYAIKGEPGVANTEYRTEKESFAKITIFNSGRNQYFKVETKDGKTLEYGNSANSKVILSGNSNVLLWRLNKITDHNGNFTEYLYKQEDGESWIDQINYSGNTNSINFYYDKSSSFNSGYIGGYELKQNKLLREIQVNSQNQLLRAYKFNYTKDELDQDHLIEIVETNGANEQLNSTVIDWGQLFDSGSLKYSITPVYLGNSKLCKRFSTGDFNGDGKMDFIVALKGLKVSDRFTKWELYISNGNNTYTKKANGVLNDNFHCFYTGDFDGDGDDDIYKRVWEKHSYTYEIPCPSNGGDEPQRAVEERSVNEKLIKEPDEKCYTTRSYWRLNLQFFSFNGSKLLREERKDKEYRDRPNHDIENLRLINSDFDGDGKMDILALDKANNFFYLKNIIWYHGPDFNNPDEVTPIDFNGNGATDIMVVKGTICKVFEYQDYKLVEIYNGSPTASAHERVYGDFNGDGKTDFLIYSDTEKKRLIYCSTGKTFKKMSITVPTPPYPGDHFKLVDIDKDGKTDIVSREPVNEYGNPNKVEYKMYINRGNKFVKISVKNSIEYWKYHRLGEDFNSDGSIDFTRDNYYVKAYFGKSGYFYSASTSNYFYINSFNFTPNNRFVTSITDGFKRKTKINYKSLCDNSVYTRGHTNLNDVSDFQGDLYVVSNIVTSDGLGGSNTLSYKYEGAKIHRTGKGFLGFSKTTMINESLGQKVINTYDVDPKFYSVSLKKSEVMTTGGSLISSITNTNKIKDLSEHIYTPTYRRVKRYFPYVEKSIRYDGLQKNTNTSDYVYDEFGNPTKVSTKHGDDASTVVDGVYISKGAWCKSRLQKSTVTKTYTGETPFVSITNYTYKDNGNLATQLKNGITSTYEYDSFGNIIQEKLSATGMDDRITTRQYDNSGRFLLKETNPLLQNTTYTYNSMGQVLKTTDVAGLSTSYTYNNWGELRKMVYPDGNTTVFSTGWGTGNALYYTYKKGNGSPYLKSYFDELGREIKTETTGFNGKILKDTQYNSKGQISQTSNPYYEGEAQKWVSNEYDNYGRLTKSRYNSLETHYTYNGKISSITLPSGQIKRKTVNALGDVLVASDNGGEINYKYHSSGQTREIISNGSTVSMTYDANGLQKTLSDPDAGTISYSYNGFGEIKEQKDASGNIILSEYDKGGRLVKKTCAGMVSDYVFYNTGKQNRLLKYVSNSNNTRTDYEYNSLGQLIIEKENIKGKEFQTSYSYDNYGRVNSIAYPSGFAVSQHYNQDGYLTEVKRADNQKSIWKANKMNALGQHTEFTSGNGHKTIKEYDSNGFIHGINTGNRSVQNLEYNFTPSTGNLENRIDRINNLTETFKYDNLNRLLSSEVNGLELMSQTYKPNGNIKTKTDVGTYGYTSNKPHAVTGVTNAKGLIRTNQTINYTSFNSVSDITEGDSRMTFIYGDDFQRRKTILYENNQEIVSKYFVGSYEQENYKDNIKKVNYVFGGEGIAAIYISDNSGSHMYYIHKDHLGSIQAVTSDKVEQNHGIVAQLSFDAWGRKRNASDWSYTNIKDNALFNRGYTGHEHLDDFGLINMNGRVYDPLLGRFLSPDNYVQMPDFTQNFNRFGYCLNNPLIYSDPTGDFFLSLLCPALAPIDIMLWGMAIDYTSQVIGNIAKQNSTGQKINWGNALWGDVDFFDVAVSGLADAATFGIAKFTKLPKYVSTGLKVATILGANTLKAHIDLTPNKGWDTNKDKNLVNADIWASSITTLTIGQTYGFGIDHIVPKKIIGDLASNSAISRIKNFTAKTMISPLLNKFKEATLNDIMKKNKDYYYDQENRQWRKLQPIYNQWQNR